MKISPKLGGYRSPAPLPRTLMVDEAKSSLSCNGPIFLSTVEDYYLFGDL